jgi:hypothetical protein
MAKKSQVKIGASMTIDNRSYNIPPKMFEWGGATVDGPTDEEILANPDEFLNTLEGFQKAGTVLNLIFFLCERFFKIMGGEIFEKENPDRNKIANDLDKILRFFGEKADEVNIDNGKLSVSFTSSSEKEKEETIKEIDLILKGELFSKILSQVPKGVWTVIQKNQEAVTLRKENERLKAELKREQKKEKKRLTRMSIHGISQFYGDNKQLTIFSDGQIDDFVAETGITLRNRPENYGIVLTQTQNRVLEGILKAFSETNYIGNATPESPLKPLEDVYPPSTKARERLLNSEKAPYKNIDSIPVVRLTQAEIIDLSGFDLAKQRQGDKQDVVEAVSFLATHQFFFYWNRLKTDPSGKPVKDKSGNFAKEEVNEIGTLLRVKTVKDPNTGTLLYYEIHPSAVLLDQISSYFLLIPTNWREDVKLVTGSAKISKYSYEFLLWLRLSFEHIRRYNKNNTKRPKKEFRIKKTWEEMAITLKMPETMYKLNRKKSSKIIQDAYNLAIQLGYLIAVEKDGGIDILVLNEEFYPEPGKLN